MKKYFFITILTGTLLLGNIQVFAANTTEDVSETETQNSVLDILEDLEDRLNANDTQDKEVLTLEKAVERAMSNSTSLKESRANLEYSEDQRLNLVSEFYNDDSLSSLLSLLTNDLNYDNSVLSQQQLEETLTYTMKETYISLIIQERQIALDKQNAKLMENQLAITRMKASLGLITETELEAEETSYATTLASIETAENSLEQSYISFNYLIGESSDKRFQLELDPEYEEFVLPATLDSYVTARISENISLQQQENNVKMAENEYKLYDAESASAGERTSLKNSLNSAEMSLSDQKDELDTQIRSCYNSIVALEKEYENTLAQLETQYKTMEITETKYKQGTITELEYLQEQYELMSLENTLVTNAYEHMLLVDQMENSNLL